mmetsp:Transcript_140121/g.447133  ORF Transcript_140121/g.447133 Transcript_140121/m.447133 type:complete len:299 (+) Transcript_140121:318-1214(+)
MLSTNALVAREWPPSLDVQPQPVLQCHDPQLLVTLDVRIRRLSTPAASGRQLRPERLGPPARLDRLLGVAHGHERQLHVALARVVSPPRPISIRSTELCLPHVDARRSRHRSRQPRNTKSRLGLRCPVRKAAAFARAWSLTSLLVGAALESRRCMGPAHQARNTRSSRRFCRPGRKAAAFARALLSIASWKWWDLTPSEETLLVVLEIEFAGVCLLRLAALITVTDVVVQATFATTVAVAPVADAVPCWAWRCHPTRLGGGIDLLEYRRRRNTRRVREGLLAAAERQQHGLQRKHRSH